MLTIESGQNLVDKNKQVRTVFRSNWFRERPVHLRQLGGKLDRGNLLNDGGLEHILCNEMFLNTHSLMDFTGVANRHGLFPSQQHSGPRHVACKMKFYPTLA